MQQGLFELVHLEHGATIKRWQINQGKEFINSDLMDTLKGLGIVIEQSVPHQHQQNGQAERAIKLSWKKHSAYASWCACHNHGGNSALTTQFTLSTELLLHTFYSRCL